MSVGDECTLRVVGRYQGQNIVNTLHYRIVGQVADETAVLQILLDEWEQDIKVAWLARHIDTYELVGLKAFGKTGASKTPAFASIGENGVVVGEEVTSPVCRTITLYTDDIKHRRRGRLMLSGSAVSMFDTADGSVTTVEITALSALGGTLENALDNGSDQFKLGIPATATDSWQDIVDSKGRETPSVVRSRRIKQFLVG